MLLRLDELNALKGNLEENKGDINKTVELMSDWLFLAYADGKTDVEEQLNGQVSTPVEHVMDVITADIGGKNVFERLVENIYLEDIEVLLRLFTNERNRVYNTASFDTANELGAKSKTWHTMRDDRVRDPHAYLEGMTKGIDEKFYTYNGDATQYPGGFGIAEEDINCRCYLTFSK